MSFFTIMVLFLLYYNSAKTALLNRTFDQLTSVMTLKKSGIILYFESRKREVQLFSSLYSTKLAFVELNNTFNKYGTNNPNYDYADKYFGKTLEEFNLHNHYINVWLINLKGDVVYTANNNIYRGKNIFNKREFTEEFAHAAINGLEKPIIADIKSIKADDNKPYLLLFCPIKDDFGGKLGLIMSKIDMKDINFILSQRTGMGTTGESYVVNKNFKMRSLSRFITPDTNMITVKTEAAKNAFSFKSGKAIISDYRGIEVLSVYSTLDIDLLQWAILSEIDLSEAMLNIVEFRNNMILISFFVLLSILAITLYLAKQISNPIKALNLEIKKLSAGILPNQNLSIVQKDEIGQMAESINQLVRGLKKTSEFAHEIGKNNLKVHYQPLGPHDMLGHALLDMREKLVMLSKQIEEQNKIKTIALVEGQEKERRRIARDMHDGIGQMLTALKFKIQEIPYQDHITSDIKTRVDDIIKEIRRITINLMPGVLWDFGLDAAINQLIKTLPLKVQYTYLLTPGSPELTIEERIALYRIAQEALNNIIKYAHVKHASLHIDHTPTFVSMKISDNGSGFDVQSVMHQSGGLINIKERAHVVNGTLDIQSTPGKGTTITTHIPFE